jgi:hypothetical protein
MERRRSFGSTPLGRDMPDQRGAAPRGHAGEPRGSAVNYPGNPRFRPPVAFKIANTTEEMEQAACHAYQSRSGYY